MVPFSVIGDQLLTYSTKSQNKHTKIILDHIMLYYNIIMDEFILVIKKLQQLVEIES